MRKKNVTIWTGVIAMALMFTAAARASLWPVADGGNGHYYERVEVSPGIDWFAAKDLAEARTFSGVNGYLATITSAAENQFIVDNFFPSTPVGEIWIGGYQPDSHPGGGYPEPDQGWTWVTGEAWHYTNWAPPEPTNSFSAPIDHEDTLVICDVPYSTIHTKWNDEPHTSLHTNLIVEYPVPAPGALVLASIGMGLVGWLHRRRML